MVILVWSQGLREPQIKEKNRDHNNRESHSAGVLFRPLTVGTNSVSARAQNKAEDLLGAR